jgi:hypothetical protein
MKSDRVKRILERQPLDRGEIVDRIEVPANIAEIRRNDPKAAREVQKSIGERFQRHFAEGRAVIAVEKNAQAGVYVIGHAEIE